MAEIGLTDDIVDVDPLREEMMQKPVKSTPVRFRHSTTPV
jgi:hypothetical protein